jgi:hypothetical protein
LRRRPPEIDRRASAGFRRREGAHSHLWFTAAVFVITSVRSEKLQHSEYVSRSMPTFFHRVCNRSGQVLAEERIEDPRCRPPWSELTTGCVAAPRAIRWSVTAPAVLRSPMRTGSRWRAFIMLKCCRSGLEVNRVPLVSDRSAAPRDSSLPPVIRRSPNIRNLRQSGRPRSGATRPGAPELPPR